MLSNIYYSTELRWFLPRQGQIDPLLEWFRLQNQLPLREEGLYDPRSINEPFVKLQRERSDKYLLLPACDTAGIKLREGKLEVKVQIGDESPFSLEKITGHMNHWVKWSFDPSDSIADQLGIELSQSGPWRKVSKNRYLQKHSLDSGSLVAVSPDQFPEIGCNIELTLVTVRAAVEKWVTFGFEAFGPSAKLSAVVDEVVQHFFSAHGSPPVPLEGRDSLSYPAWLAMLNQHDDYSDDSDHIQTPRGS